MIVLIIILLVTAWIIDSENNKIKELKDIIEEIK